MFLFQLLTFYFSFCRAFSSPWIQRENSSGDATKTVIDFILAENLIKSDGNEKLLMGMLMNKIDIWNHPTLMIPFLYRNDQEVSLSSLYLLSTVMQKGKLSLLQVIRRIF